MSGEITLKGKILPVRGIKEKVLAAHRAGIKKVILPEGNQAQLEEVPSDIKKEIHIILVDNIFQVVEKVFIRK